MSAIGPSNLFIGGDDGPAKQPAALRAQGVIGRRSGRRLGIRRVTGIGKDSIGEAGRQTLAPGRLEDWP